ncbi:MAG TPA: (Fe-S)-binding protein [Bacteroidales bacterium]|nr:(Fe-S)-binding protein [Bacteroidales bacterium]HRZ49770.1 (Fe-S)-binding protein [Bacteroidales bacterium]
MNYNHFVIPFAAGALILFAILVARYAYWIVQMPRSDRRKAWTGFFRPAFFRSLWEVFRESLIHKKVFRVNAMLGWMHMSFAFGWFLLIIFGTIETKFHKHKVFNMPYDPIFLRYFEHDEKQFFFSQGFSFVMDFLLLILLAATFLAIFKRIRSRFFGMKRTTRLILGDRIALYSLWSVFPLRFLAESFTSGLHHNGGFLTGTAGIAFSSFLPLQQLELPAWWAYSSALFVFFVFLPFSRYNHIPTELFLIFLRNCGIKTSGRFSGFTEFEIYSCSRCGICIDKCQLAEVRPQQTQAVYFLQQIRRNILQPQTTFNCLQCGRCTEFCPVGIKADTLRSIKRTDYSLEYGFSYKYAEEKIPPPALPVDVGYFAGCMTHLTPSIKIAMENIMKKAGVRYHFIDRDGTVCCGRPLSLSGNERQARLLMRENKYIIRNSGIKTLVTSCPICLRVFRESYDLGIEVLHHSQYLLRLAEEGKISLKPTDAVFAYHDPCDLGRGLKIYEEPRMLIARCGELLHTQQEKNEALCCGNSLADFVTPEPRKQEMRDHTLQELLLNNPDALITACPLCKKSLTYGSNVPVKDIAELVAENQ